MPRLSKIGAAALAAFGWTSGSSVTASYLVVAGGGAGGGGVGGHGGGGGGAGGYRTGTASLNPALSYTVTVGAGASGTTGTGTAGSSSTFNATTSAGGGGGGTATAAGTAGGSGGGGGSDGTPAAGGAGNTPSTSPSQGNNGGQGITDNASYSANGGGGGAGAVGSAGVNGQSGAGGNGTSNSITGSSATYSGGGGGGQTDQSALGAGGSGGGGAGGAITVNGTAGTANLGGGGGGAGRGTTTGGNGGSGVVIISYVGAQQFGGGVVTSSGGNTIHTFTTSGTLSPLSSLTAQYLVVGGGGGGGGGGGFGGGGGAGGFLSTTGVTIDTNSNYVVTVGAGGAASTGGNGGSGTLSSFLTLTAAGGGYGGGFNTVGASGGSGGGGGESQNGGSGNTPSTTPSQGSNGGKGSTTANGGGGGGGGASAVGGSPTNSSGGGAGGAGSASSISGTSTYYAGGGGGCTATTPAPAGGTGGGGNGSFLNNIPAVAGTANTGGGGGGGYLAATYTGAAGGSGIVIISYPGSTQQMAGGTVTISGGNVIHTFTSSGYLTPIKYASRSLRFRSSATAYLNRTSGTPTSGSIFTHSFWVKRGALGAGSTLIAGQRPTNFDRIYIQSNDTLLYQWNDGTSNLANVETTQVFRDPSAWYHIVVATDTTQATASNRVKIYVNGVQVTALTSTTYPSQNSTSYFNTNAVTLNIGRSTNGTFYLDGYLTEVNFVDGAALTPSSFGTFNSYGVWQPITYGGSYGANGFYLTFGNNTSTTTLGYDTSPQGNNWTTNNISVTAGVTYDSMLDVPTLTSSTVNNYCVLNPLITDYTGGSGPVTVRDGNLQLYRPSASGWGMCGSTFGVSSGKWYWEAINTGSNCVLGIHKTQPTTYFSIVGYNEPNGYGYGNDGNKLNNNTGSAYGATYANGDVIGVALDMDAGTLTFYKNNTSQGVAFSGLSGTFMPAFSCAGLSYWDANFGQQGFVYTPPSGFVALNTYNLSTPTIPNGAVYFAATTYTGTGATQVVTNTVNGTAMQPDFVWLKSRSAARDHRLMDTNRGINNILYSDLTIAESAGSALSSVNSNGFTLNTTDNQNVSSETYIGWQWKANAGTNVSNTSGTITSTVSANTTAGFSVVTYTGTNTAATVGHGLGVAPSMIIVKQRNSAVENWLTYHSSLTNPTTSYLYLNSTAAQATTASYWNGGPTSSVFGIGAFSGINASAGTYVAYVFAAVAGYSAFGSYTGNGSTDGPFVYLGFRPRFIMVKCSSNSTGSTVWTMWDTSRSPYNASVNELYANLNSVESVDASGIDILSNGFKPKRNSEYANTSGWTYIYMAFAENPFKYSNAR